MVKEQLTSEMMQSGKDLVKKLDETKLKISSAFWFYLEDSEKWRFILSSPQVSENGPKKVYQQIQKILNEFETGDKLDLKDIGVLEENHSLINLIGEAVGKVKGISEIRFSKNTINGHYIEDVLVYRLNSSK